MLEYRYFQLIFRRVRKIASSCLSVRLSDRMELTGSH